MRWIAGALLAVLASQIEDASACACCDAKYRRTPIGWNDASSLLVDAFDTDGCEHKRRLEIWPIGAKEPAGCFDLYGDPEKKIACANISFADRPNQPAKTSSQPKAFPKKAAQLDPKKVREKQYWISADRDELQVTVEIDKGGWQRAWSGAIRPVRQDDPPVTISVWPNARGDRAMLLVGYHRTGTGNEAVDVHWVDLR